MAKIQLNGKKVKVFKDSNIKDLIKKYNLDEKIHLHFNIYSIFNFKL